VSKLPTPILVEAAAGRTEPWFAPHQDAGGFFNPWRRFEMPGPGALLKWRTTPSPWRAQKAAGSSLQPLPAAQEAWAGLAQSGPSDARAMWLGHASVYAELDGLGILIDPVFSTAGPGVARKVALPVVPEALPRVDLVLVSHGHYDHLDRASLERIGRRWPKALFVCPLGLGQALPGSAAGRTVELDWWQAVLFGAAPDGTGGVRLALSPAQHWHRRGLFDMNRSLWGGWHLKGSKTLFHSGDTGWFDGFGAIGEVLGAPDLAILPLGAWAPRWFMSGQHMDVAESVAAAQALGARAVMGMHWGTFDLTDEPLDIGPELLRTVVQERSLDWSRYFAIQPGAGIAIGADPAATWACSGPRLG
jgi:L-ascorbate metabolism protein UlaG (beta-lactamase superfamily)